MTNKQFLLVATPFVLFLLTIGYCVPKSTVTLAETVQIKKHYMQHIGQMDSAVTVLKKMVKSDAPLTAIHQAFYNARLTYKQIEFLAEYYNPYTAKHINGPAIDEVEEDDPLQKIVPPNGFQVIEELLFPAYDSENKLEVLREISVLHASVNRLNLVTQTTKMADRHIFDAMRQQIYRIITLGITGFDSPIAFHSMPEAATSLQSLKQTFLIYQPQLTEKSPELLAQTEKAFDASIAYLQKNQDFNSFDRVAFITDYANALSASLADAQQALQIPAPAGLRAFSPTAKTLFDKDAFNADYYAPDHDSHLTVARAELGKILFFDPILSGNNYRSCASCHNPDKAFADGQAKSIAFDFKGQVSRNAPTIINAGLQRSLFHDMRVVYLEDQASDVLANEKEMHGSFKKATVLVAQSLEYVEMFKKAFPGQTANENTVTEQQMKVAIASYVRSLTGMNSRFDQYMRGDKTQLSAREKSGLNLFMGKAKCATCHFVPLFNGTVPPEFDHTEAEIIGVPASTDTLHPTLDADLGKFALYQINLHKFAFKTPTLRNVALTAPYMHNGVYTTMEEVVDFYNKGGGAGLGIDVPNQTLPADPLHLTLQEKKDLVAFMQTLTDTTGFTARPERLPAFPHQLAVSKRQIGGKY